ncbi:zinc finger, C2H2 type [Ostertagia ostertagi]
MRTTALCIVCGLGPQCLSNIYKHLRRTHGWSEEQIDQEKLRLNGARARFSCNHCERVFTSKRSLKKHKECPRLLRILKVVCPQCDQRFLRHQDLAKHCESSHCDENTDSSYFSIFNGTFDSVEEFRGRSVS